MTRPRLAVRTAVFGGTGAVVTAIAVGLVVAPDRLLALPVVSTLADGAADADSQQVLLVVAAFVVLFTLWLARPRRDTGTVDVFEHLETAPPETVSTGAVLAGQRFDEQFETAVRPGRSWGDSPARAELRATAIDVVSLTEGREAATRAVDAGTWTEDSLAAATLAGPGGPRPSLWARLRHWLDPTAERERRIDRTLAALESRLEADR